MRSVVTRRGLLRAIVVAATLATATSARSESGVLESVRAACRHLDRATVRWTEIVRSRASAEVVSLAVHEHTALNGKVRHVAWIVSPEKANAVVTKADPITRGDWDHLAREASAARPRFDLWDGVRHTMCTPNRSGGYTVTVLAAPRRSQLFARPFEWILFYAETRIDALGGAWTQHTGTGDDGRPRAAFGAPQACLYFAFDEEPLRTSWVAMWGEPWETAAPVLARARSLEEIATRPAFLGGATILEWHPPSAGGMAWPALVRHIRPHVDQVSVTRLDPMQTAGEPVDTAQIPAEIRGHAIAFSDEVTHEAFVQSPEGLRRPMSEGSRLGGQPPPPGGPPTAPAPPRPSKPDDSKERPSGGRVWLIVIGCALLLAGAYQLRRSRRPNPGVSNPK